MYRLGKIYGNGSAIDDQMDDSPHHEDDTITTTVQTNDRGDVRIPAEVRRALGFNGQEAILEITISCKKILDDD